MVGCGRLNGNDIMPAKTARQQVQRGRKRAVAAWQEGAGRHEGCSWGNGEGSGG